MVWAQLSGDDPLWGLILGPLGALVLAVVMLLFERKRNKELSDELTAARKEMLAIRAETTEVCVTAIRVIEEFQKKTICQWKP